MRKSSSITPSLRLTVQSSPFNTLPRSLSPSNEPPVIGNVTRVPCGPAPMSWVGAVLKWSVIRGRVRMAVLVGRGPDKKGAGAKGVRSRAHPTSAAPAANLKSSRRFASSMSSPDLEDRISGTFGASIAGRYGEQPIQKRVLRVRRLEAGRGAKIVGSRVEHF